MQWNSAMRPLDFGAKRAARVAFATEVPNHQHCGTNECVHVIAALPSELLIKIFGYLPLQDTLQVRSVCQRWLLLGSLPEFHRDTKLVVNERNLANVFIAVCEGDSVAYGANMKTLMRWPHLHLIGLPNSGTLHRVLQAVGDSVRSLRLQNSAAIKSLPALLPHVQEITLNYDTLQTSEYLSSLDLTAFPNLAMLDMLDGSLPLETRCKLLHKLTNNESNVRLRRLCIRNCEDGADVEDMLLEVIEAHAATLTHLTVHFSVEPTATLSDWCDVFMLLNSLECLKLSGTCRYLVGMLQGLPDVAPLRQISLGGIKRATDFVMELISNKWSRTLEHMQVMFCNEITDRGVFVLGKLREKLRILDISFCTKLTGEPLLRGVVSSYNTTLTELVLDGLCQIDDEELCELSARLPNLRTISLVDCHKGVTNRALAHILRNQKQLRCINLDDCISVTDQALAGIWLQRGLHTLSLRGCRGLTDQALSQFLVSRHLRVLNLGYNRKFTSEGIEQLVQNCPAIEELIITSCQMVNNDAVLHIAKGLRRLRKLNVSNCPKLTQLSIDYIQKYCTSLQNLTLCGVEKLSLSVLQLAYTMPTLKELRV